MRERLRELRKVLSLSQSEFADKIHIAQTTYSQLETGARIIKDIHIAQICSAFNVNETWLRTGVGEMFSAPAATNLDDLIQRFSFPEICCKLLQAFDGLAPDQQEAVLAYSRRFLSSVIQQQPQPAPPSPGEKAARQFLAQRLEQEQSSSSITSDETA